MHVLLVLNQEVLLLYLDDKAIIREIRGEFYLMFQVVELRKHQLIDSRVRCYSMLTNDNNTNIFGNSPYQFHRMRLHYPDDNLGSLVLLSVPVVIVHHIDKWSPLYPLAWKKINKL